VQCDMPYATLSMALWRLHQLSVHLANTLPAAHWQRKPQP
jgi:hypothetical protein